MPGRMFARSKKVKPAEASAEALEHRAGDARRGLRGMNYEDGARALAPGGALEGASTLSIRPGAIARHLTDVKPSAIPRTLAGLRLELSGEAQELVWQIEAFFEAALMQPKLQVTDDEKRTSKKRAKHLNRMGAKIGLAALSPIAAFAMEQKRSLGPRPNQEKAAHYMGAESNAKNDYEDRCEEYLQARLGHHLTAIGEQARRAGVREPFDETLIQLAIPCVSAWKSAEKRARLHDHKAEVAAGKWISARRKVLMPWKKRGK
ncbi:MAG: hypothetical protein H6746_05240 [Deltaproteobacteria bacterium]|nr:hypothetical protein [Deltaproteobacteria bacterium]